MTEYARLVLSVDSTSAKKATDELRIMIDVTAKADKSNQELTKSTNGLGKAFGALAAAISVRAIIAASDQYGQMAARIRMATSSTEEYTKVQDRLLQTANATYRPLNEAQEVYIRTADAIRTLGYNTDDALDITDSFSFLLVTNAASADKASSAIDAYSKAIQTGKVESDGWQSILAAMPTIVNDLAAATGRSTADIRKLGIEGKLSLAALNEALRQSRDSNEELAAAMETSVQDATTALGNSFQVFVGKVNETSKASGILTENIGEMADALQDPETIKAAQDLAAGVVSALNEIIKGVRETVGIVKWGAESISAALNGAAGDDVVRLQDQLETYQSMLDNPLKRLRIGGKGQAVAYFNEEEIKQNIELTQKQIDAFWKEQEQRKPNLPEPVPEPKVDSKEKAKVEAEAAAAPSKAKRAAMTDEQRAANQLATAYKNVEKSLAQQVALFGQSTEVARVKYDLENGELSKLNAQQKQHLLDLATELDAKQDLVDQDNIRLAILQETGQLQAANDMQFELDYAKKIAQYEKDGNTAALARLKTLKAIQDANREADVKPGTVEGVTKAPHTSGVDADVGGASSEMIKLDEEAKALQDWRDTELKKQLEYLDAKAINEEEYSKRVANIHQQSADEQRAIDAAKNQALMAGGESLFGNLAGLAKEFAGEQSGLYKTMFAVQKAFAIAQTIVNTETASAAALAPPPIGLGPVAGAPYSQVIRAMGYTSAALIGATAISGMAHDGIDNIPKEGTWLLDRGERVVDRRTNGDLKDFLNRQGNTSTTTNSKTNNISLNVYGITDAKGMQESTARLARQISSAVSKSDRYA
ncbi:tape measure protein [Pseudomonas multiresinivorans]|uniref:Tape measure protein n=2 Tax=Pseudomonas nitroreducens/multiresinivorans group TaxID=627141 RepID=A0A7Z3BK59_9PSED|nr:tape measure protein [Pseudomonas multiresinivorans]QJP08410.1 tape measure protein [Pseudomonas multiresinivorans]